MKKKIIKKKPVRKEIINKKIVSKKMVKKVEKKVALARSFLPAHEKCVMAEGFEEEKIKLLFNEKKSLLFSDEEIERLWRILELGI